MNPNLNTKFWKSFRNSSLQPLGKLPATAVAATRFSTFLLFTLFWLFFIFLFLSTSRRRWRFVSRPRSKHRVDTKILALAKQSQVTLHWTRLDTNIFTELLYDLQQETKTNCKRSNGHTQHKSIQHHHFVFFYDFGVVLSFFCVTNFRAQIG